MDRILIKDLCVFAYHGVNPEEKRDGQRFLIDLVMEADLTAPSRSDDLADTVNYAAVVKLVTATVLAEKNDLIERVAGRVADAVLAAQPLVSRVTVTVKKPDAPMKADFRYVAVEITRDRG